jgi:hypothetical protein
MNLLIGGRHRDARGSAVSVCRPDGSVRRFREW